MTPTEQQRIIQQESAWIDADQFAPLDLSQFPARAPPPPPDSHDARWSKDWRDTALSASAAALRNFVEEPGRVSLKTNRRRRQARNVTSVASYWIPTSAEDTPPPSVKEIDALSDDALDRLYHDSLRAYIYATSFRRGPGVLP